MDPPDVSVRNLDYTTKGGFYVSQISGDTDENLKTATFTVSLSSAPSSDNVTITMASSDTTEGVIDTVTGVTGDNATHLYFTTSNWNSVRTVTVKGVGDNLSDGDQTYTIQLTGDNAFGSSLCECGSPGCFGEKPRLHDQRRLLCFSDLGRYR